MNACEICWQTDGMMKVDPDYEDRPIWTLTGNDRYIPCPECNEAGRVPTIYLEITNAE